MRKLSIVLAILFLSGCAAQQSYDQTKSSTGLGASPFSTGGSFTAANANSINNAINDNDTRLDTLEVVNGIIEGVGDGSYTAVDTSAEVLAVITDETGSASGTPLLVFNQNPTINGMTVSGTVTDSSATWPTWNQNTTGTAANLSGTPALPDGTTATTQVAEDGTGKLATNRFVGGALRYGRNLFGDPSFYLAYKTYGDFWVADRNDATRGPGEFGLYGENNRVGVRLVHAGKQYDMIRSAVKIPCKYGDTLYTRTRFKLSADYADDNNYGLQIVVLVYDQLDNFLEDAGTTTGVGTLNSWLWKVNATTITQTDAQYALVEYRIYDSLAAGTGTAYIDYASMENAEPLPVGASQRFVGAGTVANIPASPIAGDRYTVLDGDSKCDTTVGLGSATPYDIYYNGASWDCIGDGTPGSIQVDSLSDLDTTNAGTARRPLITDGDGTWSVRIEDLLRLEQKSAEPTDEAVNDEVIAAGYTGGWDPANQHAQGYDGAYKAVCVATGAPGTWKAMWAVSGSELYWLVDTVQAASNVITDADGIVLTASQMNSWIVMTGAGDVDIPADQCDTATGKSLRVKSTGAFLNSVTSNDASDQFVLANGTALTAGNELDLGSTAGAQVTVECLQANKWWVTGYMGATPADGGAAD